MNGNANKVEDTQVSYQGPVEDQFNPFTEEQLLAKWHEFANKYKDSQPRVYSTLIEHLPSLITDTTLKMIMNNALQENAVNEMKSDILIFLRKELKNDKISLETEIQEVISIKSAFTPAEKFRLLSDMNPALGQLRQLFDLDF